MKKVMLHLSFPKNLVAQFELKQEGFCALKFSISTSSPKLRSL